MPAEGGQRVLSCCDGIKQVLRKRVQKVWWKDRERGMKLRNNQEVQAETQCVKAAEITSLNTWPFAPQQAPTTRLIFKSPGNGRVSP